MIQLFRSKLAKQITVVFFAALMVIFLLTSVDLGSIGGPGAVGKINGRSVDIRRYESLVQQQTQVAQRQTPASLSLEDVSTIRDQVWEQLIQQQVLEEQYRRYGISVSEQEVADILRANPPQDLVQAPEFQTDSQFDIAKYQRWLTSPAAAPYVDALGAQMGEQIRRSKLLTLVTADLYISDAALWEQYRDANEKVKIALTAIIPRNVVTDSAVTITPAEVEAYYRAHRDEFKRERTAYLSGIELPRTLNAADTVAALERTRALRQEIVDGAPFAEVATRESADPVSGPRGGDLGQWKRGDFDPQFDSVAFRIPLNTVSEPVLSSFGYHLIEITKRVADTASGRHILVRIEPSGANRDRLDAATDSLDRIAAGQTDPALLDTVAKSLRLPVRKALPVPEGTRVQVGATVVPDAGVWAFQSNPGEISDVIETEGAFYLFRLDSVVDAGEPTLAAVRPAVEAAVRDQKRREAARKIAEDFLKRMSEGSTAEQAAKALNLAHREFGPFNRISPPLDIPALVGAAFGLEPGEQSGILDTEQGLYVIKSLERTPADSAAFAKDIDQVRARSIREAREVRVRNYLASLRSSAKVVDNRARVLQRSRELAPAS